MHPSASAPLASPAGLHFELYKDKAGEAAWIGKVLLIVFLFLAVIAMLTGRGTRSVP